MRPSCATSSPASPVEDPQLDLPLVRRLERAAVSAWPASVTQESRGGWLLRATPGLDRGRSNHALTPCRALAAEEIPPALQEVEAFARSHGIRTGVQVSPLALHGTLQRELDRRGWGTQWPVLVMAGPAGDAGAVADAAGAVADAAGAVADAPGAVADDAGAVADSGPGPSVEALEVADRATPEWLATWARCEPGRDVEAHARTVLRLLAGRATFARLGEVAVGIGVECDDLVGLFCVAVDPARRRAGLGTAVVRALLAGSGAGTAYLQTEAANAPAIAMYERLGFTEAYRYCHRIAPDGQHRVAPDGQGR